ncbi:VC0807 family protein [Luteipulveratus halotolerans]|nr:VC0807 family protein [Luteipulveratus halotolerans]
MRSEANDAMAAAGAYGKDVRLGGLVTMLLWDVGLPVVAYYVARAAGLSTFNALLAGTIVAGLRLLWVMWRTKEVDAFAAFMLFIFAAGTAASFATGDPRFMLLKNAVLTAVAGAVFLGSCRWGKPLCYAVARRLAGSPESRDDLARGWDESAQFRQMFRLLSAFWGFGLVLEALVRVVLIYTTPVDVAVGASVVVQILAFAVMTYVTIRSIKHARAQSELVATA